MLQLKVATLIHIWVDWLQGTWRIQCCPRKSRRNRVIIIWNATQAQRDHKTIHARNFYVQPQCHYGLWHSWVCCVSSFSGGLADVGESRCTGPPGVKSKCFWKTVSRSSVSQTPCSARNQTEEIESCGEKCTNLCRVYKLFMSSRVPGYGHLEYPGIWIMDWSQHSI